MLFKEILELVYLGNTIKQFLIFIILIIGSFALGKLVYLLFKNVLKVFTAKTKTEFDDILINILEKPLILGILILAFYIGYIQLNLPAGVEIFFDHVTRTLVTIAITWFIIKFADEVMEHYITPLVEKSETDLDDHLVPLLKKLFNGTVIIISILIILSTFGLNVSSAVAGLGIGGLAVALAAQETLKNILAGIAIITDKPYKLGEWVEINNYQGTVVEIGLRSTRLKTATGDLITVPNSIVAMTPVVDYTRYKTKKIIIQLSLSYDTPSARIEKAKTIIAGLIKKLDKVIENTVDVSLVKLNTASLDLEVKFEVSTNNGSQILAMKDSLNMDIKKAFEKEKIGLANPQMIYMKK
jgi:MscS family membrane protein